MKLTIGLKLKPTREQADSLRRTLYRANEAANEASRIAWDAGIFGQFQLHRLSYAVIRERFGLSAQVAVRIIAKVADAYKLDRRAKRVFRKDGSIAYDARILRYFDTEVSIWALDGRLRIPFTCGESQRKLLAHQQGESDLVLRKGRWYLFATIEVIEPATDEPGGFLGVDFGITQLASTSDGQHFSGRDVERVRVRTQRIKRALQRRGTKSAKRHLKKLAGRERRFKKDTNHSISKQLVAQAKGTTRALAIEDLKGFRVTVRKSQREQFGKWSFRELRGFIEYKARFAGVLVVAVNPRNTSKACSACGHIASANRRSQSEFVCVQCGYSSNADFNAACNIATRAAVVRPIVAGRGASEPLLLLRAASS